MDQNYYDGEGDLNFPWNYWSKYIQHSFFDFENTLFSSSQGLNLDLLLSSELL